MNSNWTKGKGSKSVLIGLALFLIIIVLLAFPSLFTHYDPLEQTAADRFMGLSAMHPLGTDHFGRDIFARTLYGGRMTLLPSSAALAISVIIGLVIGMIAGLHKDSIIDVVIMRLVDNLMALPFMVFAMIIAAFFGTGLFHLLVAVLLVWWVSFARLTRSIVLQKKEELFVYAARVLGAKTSTVMGFELLPQVIGPVIVQATFELGSLILTIAALSFLGLGSHPPTPEWGSMLSDGRVYFLQAPLILLGPSLFIIATVFALNLIGEGLRDRIDPYEGL